MPVAKTNGRERRVDKQQLLRHPASCCRLPHLNLAGFSREQGNILYRDCLGDTFHDLALPPDARTFRRRHSEEAPVPAVEADLSRLPS